MGTLMRFKSFVRIADLATWPASSTNGFVIWFPTYHNQRNSSLTSASPVNLVAFATNNANTAPAIADFGKASGSTNLTAASITDPAASFISSDNCQDARCISACIRYMYTGSTSTARGLIYPLTNIPIEAVVYGGTGNAPPPINQLQQYATMNCRVTDVGEVVWRPNMEGMTFRADQEGCINPSGTSGGTTSLANYTRHTGVYGIGFAFTGISSLDDLTFEFYKNVEWRSEPGFGISSVQPRGTESPSFIQRAINKLDKSSPNWQTRFTDTAMNMVSKGLQNIVLSGARGVMKAALPAMVM